ncbi:hypothetical protein [Herbiconiux sp. UC225_62]|uniref:hypothetical protein n=1 Tax=Herbiconiux sp. UC225_62 TaxID=3350168 RepID=UPI0036D39890
MPSPTAPSDSRRARGLLTPRTVHVASLAVAFVWIVICARNQWFFFDEWDFISLRSTDLLTPHLGHWSTIPMLVTAGLVRTVGLGSYWPYLVTAILVHLGLAHVLWRVLRRAGVQPWIGVLLAFVLALFGAGSENILWAFQFGFMGAILLGAICALLADGLSRERYWGRFAWIAVLSVAAVMFSGTALPMLVAVALVALRRVGFWRTALLLAPVVVAYGTWSVYARLNPAYFIPGGPASPDLGTLFVGIPSYAFRMIVGGLDGLTPVPYLSFALFAALLVYAVVFGRRLWASAPLVPAFAAAAVVFALITAYSRIDLGAQVAASSRYIYFTTAMLIPLIGVICTRLVSLRRGRALGIAVAAALGVTALYGGNLMFRTAEVQAEMKQQAREVLEAAIPLVEDPAGNVPDTAFPEPMYAPHLTAGDLRALVDAGYWPRPDAPVAPEARATALQNLKAAS